MEKVNSFAKKRVLLAGAVVAAAALVGTRVLADDSTDIESFYTNNEVAVYDNASGNEPIITGIPSQPSVVGGHTYTGWSLLAQDSTSSGDGLGSLDLFVSQFTLTNITHNATSFAVGDAVNATGQWSPFHSEPEMAFSTVASLSNSITKVSSGNAVPYTPAFTVSTLNNPAISNNLAVAGFYEEVKNVTISGSTGSFQSTFPTFAQANTVSESYTITDNTGSMTMFDFVTSDSTAGLLGGTAVPTGPVNLFGFMTVFPSAGAPGGGLPEFNIMSFQAVPEPSTVMLVGGSLLGLWAIRRRRS